MTKYIREPVNSLTHVLGAIASLIGLIFMIEKVIVVDGSLPGKLTGAIIFGLSLIFLYSASSIYHWAKTSDNKLLLLRKVDHSMIFVLIAGTYTPICIGVLDGFLKTFVLSTVWTLAVAGIALKIFWFNSPRWLYTAFYIIMGWLALTFSGPLYRALLMPGFIWLLIGGLLYTIGGVIYALKSPNLSSKFGFHELFHVFVLLGSLSHFYLIYAYIL
ncbi:PAQR family membrane homeostasis protein TrhA [Clostridium manihotivorum]|uniref:Hemolysin n=1 Tax=Clostridium manihotivorum TaxID=2320868 RepID=A0A410DRP9_9CLOT|nr:hemolysin III family protein [Clostridium manihotivorum]QAA31863.1 hemolysin [Clostridium manihotivorum]